MGIPDIDFNQLFFRVLKDSDTMVFYLSLGEKTRRSILSELTSKDLYRIYDLPYYIQWFSYVNGDINLSYYDNIVHPFQREGVYNKFSTYWHRCLWGIYSPYIEKVLDKSFYDAGNSCNFSHLVGGGLFYEYLSKCNFICNTFSINDIHFHDTSSFIRWLGEYLSSTLDNNTNLFRAALCCIDLSCIMDDGYKFHRDFIIFISNVQSNIEFNFRDTLTIEGCNEYIKDYKKYD